MLLPLALLSWAPALNPPGGKLSQQKRGKKPQYCAECGITPGKVLRKGRGGEQGHSNIHVKLLKYLHLSGSCLHPLLCWPSLSPEPCASAAHVALQKLTSLLMWISFIIPRQKHLMLRVELEQRMGQQQWGVETGVRQKCGGDSPTGKWRSCIRQEPFSSVLSEQLVVPQSSRFSPTLPMEVVPPTFPTPAPGHSLSS